MVDILSFVAGWMEELQWILMAGLAAENLYGRASSLEDECSGIARGRQR
jgi:hypothetical protein